MKKYIFILLMLIPLSGWAQNLRATFGWTGATGSNSTMTNDRCYLLSNNENASQRFTPTADDLYIGMVHAVMGATNDSARIILYTVSNSNDTIPKDSTSWSISDAAPDTIYWSVKWPVYKDSTYLLAVNGNGSIIRGNAGLYGMKYTTAAAIPNPFTSSSFVNVNYGILAYVYDTLTADQWGYDSVPADGTTEYYSDREWCFTFMADIGQAYAENWRIDSVALYYDYRASSENESFCLRVNDAGGSVIPDTLIITQTANDSLGVGTAGGWIVHTQAWHVPTRSLYDGDTMFICMINNTNTPRASLHYNTRAGTNWRYASTTSAGGTEDGPIDPDAMDTIFLPDAAFMAGPGAPTRRSGMIVYGAYLVTATASEMPSRRKKLILYSDASMDMTKEVDVWKPFMFTDFDPVDETFDVKATDNDWSDISEVIYGR